MDISFEAAVGYERDIIADLGSGEMPLGCDGGAPGAKGCVTAAEYQTIRDWFDQGSRP